MTRTQMVAAVGLTLAVATSGHAAPQPSSPLAVNIQQVNGVNTVGTVPISGTVHILPADGAIRVDPGTNEWIASMRVEPLGGKLSASRDAVIDQVSVACVTVNSTKPVSRLILGLGYDVSPPPELNLSYSTFTRPSYIFPLQPGGTDDSPNGAVSHTGLAPTAVAIPLPAYNSMHMTIGTWGPETQIDPAQAMSISCTVTFSGHFTE